MAETVRSTEERSAREARQDERGKVTAIWVLYLVALFTGLTLIIGAILAYVFRDGSPDWLRSHYDAQVRVFWWGVFWVVTGATLIAVGTPLSFIIIGIPLFILGWVVLGLSWLWVLIRSVQGLARVNAGKAF
jgi:uncharacterized membrane protein